MDLVKLGKKKLGKKKRHQLTTNRQVVLGSYGVVLGLKPIGKRTWT